MEETEQGECWHTNIKSKRQRAKIFLTKRGPALERSKGSNLRKTMAKIRNGKKRKR